MVIRNFVVPIGLAGLQTLRELSEVASVAVPLVTPTLPGQSQERDSRGSHRDAADEHMRSDYAAALAGLAERRGAPGSVRTKLSWLDYRMRQETASGRVEKGILALYRALGYGERAGPAFATYGLLATVFTVLGLITTRSPDWSPHGVIEVIRYFLDWATAPLHVLRLADRDDIPLGTSGWAFAGRVLIAVPFLTGILALRNYVKRTTPGA